MRCVSGWSILARQFAAAVVWSAALASGPGMPAASAAETNCCGPQAGHSPAVHVGVVLVVASPISKPAMTAVQAEVAGIWSRHGVKLGWLGPDHVRPDSGANVDVLLAPDSLGCGGVRPTARKTLGCFTFTLDGDSRSLITIFPQRAQQLAGVLSARICGRRCLEGWIEELHGTVLGRALAHEIGHYLLGPEHSPAGLMRAEFDPQDVLAGDPKAVSLTGPQLQRLTSRCDERQCSAIETARQSRPVFNRSNREKRSIPEYLVQNRNIPATFRRSRHEAQIIEIAGPNTQRSPIRQHGDVFMLVNAARRHVLGPLLFPTLLRSSPADAAPRAYDKAVTRALRLLPRQPDMIVVVERDERSHVRRGKRYVEAFVKHGSRVVYLVRQGVTLQATLNGPGIFDYVLATVIWHEMAHIDGADETAAQEAEERLWMKFIIAQRVDRDRGMRYLALLTNRRALAAPDGLRGRRHDPYPLKDARAFFEAQAIGRIDISRTPPTRRARSCLPVSDPGPPASHREVAPSWSELPKIVAAERRWTIAAAKKRSQSNCRLGLCLHGCTRDGHPCVAEAVGQTGSGGGAGSKGVLEELEVPEQRCAAVGLIFGKRPRHRVRGP